MNIFWIFNYCKITELKDTNCVFLFVHIIACLQGCLCICTYYSVFTGSSICTYYVQRVTGCLFVHNIACYGVVYFYILQCEGLSICTYYSVSQGFLFVHIIACYRVVHLYILQRVTGLSICTYYSLLRGCLFVHNIACYGVVYLYI